MIDNFSLYCFHIEHIIRNNLLKSEMFINNFVFCPYLFIVIFCHYKLYRDYGIMQLRYYTVLQFHIET